MRIFQIYALIWFDIELEFKVYKKKNRLNIKNEKIYAFSEILKLYSECILKKKKKTTTLKQ